MLLHRQRLDLIIPTFTQIHPVQTIVDLRLHLWTLGRSWRLRNRQRLQMWRRHITRSAQNTIVPLVGAPFGILFRFDRVAPAVQPPLALHALDDQFAFAVGIHAASACAQGCARATLGEAVHPSAVEAGVTGAAQLACSAPLALPVAVRHVVKRRIHAVDVEGNVALVAEDQARLVVALAAALADSAIQTAPAFLEDYFGDLDVYAVRVVTLTALYAGDKTSWNRHIKCKSVINLKTISLELGNFKQYFDFCK